MSKFFDNMKSAISEKKSQHKFSKSLGRLTQLPLDMPYESQKAVLQEVSQIVPGAGLSAEAAGISPSEYLKACEELIAGYWEGDGFDPESLKGSAATSFNFLLILAICNVDKPVDAGKFVKTLDWAISQAGLEDFQIWSKEKIGLFEKMKAYRDKYLPRVVIETRTGTFQRKLAQLQELKSAKNDSFSLLYFTKGVRGSFMSSFGANPAASLCRYIEINQPELLSQVFIAPFYDVSNSIKYDATTQYEHLLFCKELIISTPRLNNGYTSAPIKRSEVKRIICGYAYNAVVTDGVARNENHLIYIRILLKSGGKKVVYQSVGANKVAAMSGIENAQETIELLSEFYPFEWSDDVIDESTHFKTETRTTTTYYAWE